MKKAKRRQSKAELKKAVSPELSNIDFGTQQILQRSLAIADC
jgi:hypothetical protein